MSSRRGTADLLHELGEPLEQVAGVVGTGSGLRVVLDREGRGPHRLGCPRPPRR